MKSLLIICIGIVITLHFTDLESESTLASVVAPVGVTVFLISISIWLVMFFHGRSISQTTSRDGGSGGFGDIGDGGGD